MSTKENLFPVIALTNLDDFVERVNYWNSHNGLGLKFREQRGNSAVWLYGDGIIFADLVDIGSDRIFSMVPRKLHQMIIRHINNGQFIDRDEASLDAPMAKIAKLTLMKLRGTTLTPQEKAEWWLSVSEPSPLDEGKIIELLYWMFVTVKNDFRQPIDLIWANDQFEKNWGTRKGNFPLDKPYALHSDIPDILHKLYDHAYVLDRPANYKDILQDRPFVKAEERNGGRISRYLPLGFNLYMTPYGYEEVENSLSDGLLKNALKKVDGKVFIEWPDIPEFEPTQDLLQIPIVHKLPIVGFNIEDFMPWLGRKTKDIPSYRVKGGYIQVESLPVPWEAKRFLELTYTIEYDEGHVLPIPKGIIRFEIDRVFQTETNPLMGDYQVTIEYFHSALKPFIDELANEFEQRYPGRYAGKAAASHPDKKVRSSQGAAATGNSEHYRYSNPDERKAIVEHYYRDKKAGLIGNVATWANTKYFISDRTLRNYRKEFPKMET